VRPSFAVQHPGEKEQVQAGAFPLFQPEHAEDPRVGDRPVHDDVVAPPRDQGHHGPAGLLRLPGFVRLAIGRLQRAGGDAAEVLNRLVPGNGHPAFQPDAPAQRVVESSVRPQHVFSGAVFPVQRCLVDGKELDGGALGQRQRRRGSGRRREMGPGIDPGKLVSRGKRQDLARPRIRHLHRDGDGRLDEKASRCAKGLPPWCGRGAGPVPKGPRRGRRATPAFHGMTGTVRED